MSPAALPPNPNLEQLKKQAKSLLKGHRSADPASAQRLRQALSHFVRADGRRDIEAQVLFEKRPLVIAREFGFERWADLKRYVELAGDGDQYIFT